MDRPLWMYKDDYCDERSGEATSGRPASSVLAPPVL